MSRLALGLGAAALIVSISGQSVAADLGAAPMFKPAYPTNWGPEEDDVAFEAGVRYFYGLGGQTATIAGQDHTAEDRSHFVELSGRIDDLSTNTYLQGNIGYAAAIDGSYATPASGGTSVSTNSGRIAYGGADFGYVPFGSGNFGAGGFIGYQYLNESIDMGRASFLTASGGGDSEPNNLEVHGLRLGVTARTAFNDAFDFRVDAAAIPYAALKGTYGAFNANGSVPGSVQGSAANITGHLYGGAVEAMFGFRPTQNMVIRAGARGYYLTGPTETRFEMRDPADPATGQGYITQGNLELFRWGPVIELSGTF